MSWYLSFHCLPYICFPYKGKYIEIVIGSLVAGLFTGLGCFLGQETLPHVTFLYPGV